MWWDMSARFFLVKSRNRKFLQIFLYFLPFLRNAIWAKGDVKKNMTKRENHEKYFNSLLFADSSQLAALTKTLTAG
jgi:hypothetical protein